MVYVVSFLYLIKLETAAFRAHVEREQSVVDAQRESYEQLELVKEIFTVLFIWVVGTHTHTYSH